jgi:hypothetical protein
VSLFKTRSEGMTLYLSDNCVKNGTFAFKGMIFDDRPGVYFCDYSQTVGNVPMEAKHIYEIRSFILERLQDELKKQVKLHVYHNINDKSVYTAQTRSGRYRFWQSIGAWNPDNPPMPLTSFDTSYERITQGIVSCMMPNNGTFDYNFGTQSFENIFLSGTQLTSPMRLCYTEEDVDVLLALTQMERGLAPAAFVEIVKINQFLDGLKTARMVLADGSELQVKLGAQLKSRLDASDIFLPANHEFHFKDSSLRERAVSELKELRHGRNALRVNADAIKIQAF